jgi:hypothetical protein
MLIAGLVAAALCVTVGGAVVAHGLRTTRTQLHERRDSDHALVTDCLANVDRLTDGVHVIDLRETSVADVTEEPPSRWRAPSSSAPRSATASA